VVDDRPGEGDAPGVHLRYLVGDDEAVSFMEGRGVGEERGGVAVGADAEGDEVEAGESEPSRWKLERRADS
jgi:hypothetical protein